MVLLSLALQFIETAASLVTAGSLLAIAIHEVYGSNGWRRCK